MKPILPFPSHQVTHQNVNSPVNSRPNLPVTPHYLIPNSPRLDSPSYIPLHSVSRSGFQHHMLGRYVSYHILASRRWEMMFWFATEGGWESENVNARTERCWGWYIYIVESSPSFCSVSADISQRQTNTFAFSFFSKHSRAHRQLSVSVFWLDI